MKRLNLRLLNVFRAVVDAQSVTEAATALHVTQPAVSKAITQLEAELGFQLFSRVHGRLYPTADAQRLYSESTRLFAQVKVFHDSLWISAKVGKAGLRSQPSRRSRRLLSRAPPRGLLPDGLSSKLMW